MDNAMAKHKHSGDNAACLDIPEFRRLKYFFGQMLDARDFQAEQDFFRDKHKLHNRCLHGYGVVCGLLVEPVPFPKECTSKEEEEEKKLWDELEKLIAQKASVPSPATQTATSTPVGSDKPGAQSPDAQSGATSEAASDLDAQIEALRRRLGDFYKRHCREEPRTCIEIDCGMAIDCEGNELVVRRSLRVDVVQWLSAPDFQRVKQGADRLYVSLCYCERPVDPVRPVLSDTCGDTPDCVYGKLQDSVRVEITVDPPRRDKRCETCCEPCAEKCVLLAEILNFCPGHPLREHQIHNRVRRPISLYLPTKITGISWDHGRHYTQEQAKDLMGTHDRGEYRGKGLEIRFSRPVLASTIRPGVMETWIVEGGRGRRGGIYHKEGHFVDKPHDGTVDHIFYRDASGETLEPGDRVLAILRTDFILDECCRPVDGENVGGRVPTIKEYAEKYGPWREEPPHHGDCEVPPDGYLPWTSGNGVPGGTFVSWFYIREHEHQHEHRPERRSR
jgi:hypothetical protein